MNELKTVEKVFEGRTLTAYLWEGAPVWVAKEVGRVMEELIDGKDIELLESERLEKFKTGMGGNTPHQLDSTRRELLLLKESGFHLVCLKTDKLVGRRLRRWLAEEVMPLLVRTGSYQAKLQSTKEVPDLLKGPSAKKVFEEYKPLVLAAMGKKAAGGNLEAAHMYLSLGKSSQEVKGETILSEEGEHPTKTSQIESLLLFGAKPAELIKKGFSKTLVYTVFKRLRARTPATDPGEEELVLF
jgi:prophage antirepressor-like protein